MDSDGQTLPKEKDVKNCLKGLQNAQFEMTAALITPTLIKKWKAT